MSDKKILNKEYGFTLIELLLGLLIASIIGVMIFSTFSTGMRLERKSEVISDVYREVNLAFSLMEKDLQRMLPYDFSNSYEDLRAFAGEKDKISFIVADHDELKRISYYLLQSDDGFIKQTIIGKRHSKNVTVRNVTRKDEKVAYLVREEIPFVDFLKGSEPDKDSMEIICSKVKENSLDFSYLFYEDEERKDTFLDDSWRLEEIPSNVHFDIEIVLYDKKQTIKKFTKDIFIPTGSIGLKDEES